MIQPFTLECPKNIYFGKGTREKLPGIIDKFGNKIFVLTGTRWLTESGWKNKIIKILQNYGVNFFSCPGGEPTVKSVRTILNHARDFSPDVIIGIGGGTVLDTAKAVSGLISAKGKIEDYLEGIGIGIALQQSGVPWIAIPTTSGTGAEVTKNSVIKSLEHKVKKSLRSPFLIADTVLIDPELTLDLPLYISGISGMDAFVQLLESYVSKKAKPIPRALVKNAIPVMYKALKKIASDSSDINARTGAAYGSLISGLALANSGLGAVHGFASAFGGLYEIPHGLVCAVLLNPVLKINAQNIEHDIKDLFCDFISPENNNPIEWLIKEVNVLLDLYHIKSNFKDYNIDKKTVQTIAQKAVGSSMSGNPRDLTIEEKEKIILEVI